MKTHRAVSNFMQLLGAVLVMDEKMIEAYSEVGIDVVVVYVVCHIRDLGIEFSSPCWGWGTALERHRRREGRGHCRSREERRFLGEAGSNWSCGAECDSRARRTFGDAADVSTEGRHGQIRATFSTGHAVVLAMNDEEDEELLRTRM
jgi:hypothetical protein